MTDRMAIARHHDTTPTLDAEEVFRFLGYNPNDPAARAVVGLCLRYQLDPFAGHIIVIAGRRSPYVTRDGHLWLAHRSGQFDGMETLEERVDDKNCYARVAVWRKDMSHPFVYTGRCPLKNDRGGWDHNADKKAVANAEVRALKRAFPLQLPSIVDYEDDLEQSGGSRNPSSVPTDADASPPDATPPPSSTPPEGGGANSPPARIEQEVSPTEADRSRADGSNQQHTEHGAGTDDAAPGATVAPDGSDSPDRPSGGAKRSRPGGARGRSLPGRDDPDEAEQAAFGQQLADDPGRFTR